MRSMTPLPAVRCVAGGYFLPPSGFAAPSASWCVAALGLADGTGLGGLLGNTGGSGSRFGGSAQLFLDAGRRRDRRDREVAGDGRLDALRQRDPRDVERIVDVEAGQVGDDPVRDGVRRAEQLHPVADDVEHAATADTGRVGLVDELDRHLDLDPRSGDDAQEVDMQRPVADRIELEVAGQRADRLAVDLDLGHGGEESAGVNLEEDVAVGKVDSHRRLLAAVDDCGDLALATDCSGGPLAHLFADRRRELVAGAHRTTP